MTTTAEPLPPAPRPTRFDRWRSRMDTDPARARLLGWLAPLLVTVIAGVLRLWNIGHPRALVFDETYYVKDSWSQWVLGFPATWPDGADDLFVGGEPNAFDTSGSYVVHPPLGRYLIGAGMALFGPESSVGWRFSAALFGTATVLVLFFVARELTNSLAFATIASGLLAIDGVGIVLSRISLLDIFLTFFILLAFWFVLLDRRRHLDRLAALVVRANDSTANFEDDARPVGPRWGPILWRRPWLIAAGAALGAAAAVKWSGLYALAAVGLYVVITDALARRRAGVQLWPADAVRQGVVAFVLLVPIAAAVYLASWSGWLLTDGGYSRHAVDDSPAAGLWSWVPLALQNLWAYHQAIYGFHVGLTSPHGYASPAWQWPLLVRPTSMWWHQDETGQGGCTLPTGCTEAISSIANPVIWWAGIAAAVYLAVRFVVTRDWRFGFVLTGLAATYVPWLLYPERTIFQFYTIVILPFLVLALAFALRDIGGSTAPRERRRSGQIVVWAFLALAVVLSAFWYPVWTALPVPYEFWRLHNWLPTWV